MKTSGKIKSTLQLFLAFQLFGSVQCQAYAASSPDWIWIEGEATSAVEPGGFQTPISGGPKELLSDAKWLTLPNTPIPDSGITLNYTAEVTSAAAYDVWMRLGYEKVRCVFDWRIDQGQWQTVPSTKFTVDVQELGVWAPVAWMNMGKQTLSVGKHIIQLRFAKALDKNGKPANALFGLDAICLSSKPFRPDGAIKPGDRSWMSDADKAAQAQVFEAALAAPPVQTPVSLAGAWQYAGDDELVIDDRLGPVKTIPEAGLLTWHAILVPGDRNALLPHETYIHRFYLRTRVKVPAELAGHSFVLHVPGESLIATLFVNGQQCGWTKNCWAVWDCDVTSAIKPGQVNEIWMAIKDPFYALAGKNDAEHLPYVPYAFWKQGLTNTLDMPIAMPGPSMYRTGLFLGAPVLLVGGSVYTSDVFPISSVRNKTLGLEITLHNTAKTGVAVQIANEIQPLSGGAAEKTFATREVLVSAGQDAMVKLSEAWPTPKLW